MLNHPIESLVFQEPSKFNKPHILIKIGLSKDLNARAKKVYNVLVRKLISQNLVSYKTNEIQTTVSELSKLLNTSAINELYLSLEELKNCGLIFEEKYISEEEDTILFKNEGRKRNLSITHTNLVSSITRNTLNDNIVIRFDTYLTSKIIEFSDRYAKLDLEDLNNMKNTYAISLYEICIKSLCAFEHRALIMTEQDLRLFLNVQNKYLDFRLFNQCVINKACDEINKKTKISISVKREKIDGINTYRFELNQSNTTTFKRFKEYVERKFCDIEFRYRGNSYMIMKLEDKDKYLICSALTFKTKQTSKAKEIWEFLYALYLNDLKKFILDFVLSKDLSNKLFEVWDEEEITQALLKFEREVKIKKEK